MPVDLTQFPSDLATQLGVSTFAGQLIASGIMIALFVFPTIFLSKTFRLTDAISIVMAFISMSVCVALGWLPVWVFAITSLLIAFLFARSFMGLGSG